MARVRIGIALGAFLLAGAVAAPAAPAKKHWAFQAPVRPDPPAVQRGDWARTPIDLFILARLEKEGLAPSPEADRTTLLRRLGLDLIGLPPAPDDVDAFLADTSPGAYALAVERLLASPHYGERWGRHWLDAARYADSNGYEKDRAREVWHWRDWVIEALNRDLPYDRFIVEQLAGDLLPDATQDQRIATGFLRNSMINEEGAIDPEQFRMEAMFDRMDCIGKSIIGLTIQCAQCHSHKYDPLTQEEYYRLFAFINDDEELTAPYYTPKQLEEIDAVRRGIREVEDGVKRDHPDWAERVARWEDEERRRPQPEWTVLEPYEYGDPGGLSKLQLQLDRSLLAGGHRFGGGTWRVRARTDVQGIRAVRLELFTNGNLPRHGPGRSDQGLLALRELRLTAAPVADPTKAARVAFREATADFEEPLHPAGATLAKPESRLYGPVRFAVDGEDRTSWTIDAGPGRRNADRKAVFVAAEPFGVAGGTELTFELAMEDEVACFRLSVTAAEGALADPLPRRVREAISKPRETRSDEESRWIFSAWRSRNPELIASNLRIEMLWRRHPEPAGSTLVLESRKESRVTRTLKRGDWLKPDAPVEPGVPAFLHPLPGGAPHTRLGFAEWIADARSPTTARVIVNRIWQAYFGTGIVSTVEDLGTQAAAPSHPELLDWLACELMDPRTAAPGEEGRPAPWSLKHIHRLITGSAVYRQSSAVKPEHLEKDPLNRLLARGPRQRVEGEVVRDIALASSGLLNPKVGGPSVFAPAPEFLFRPPTSYDTFPWRDETGPNRYRRAFYTFRRRSTPYPVLQAFDAPSGEISCVRRQRSNTPLQALATLNETLFVEAARALARKTVTEGGSSEDQRIAFAFRRAVSRAPSEHELGVLRSLAERQRRRIAEGSLDAPELATGKREPPADLPPGATPADLAVLTVVARAVLNLDETITKE